MLSEPTASSLASIATNREYAATIISSMMAMITAKLARIRWRKVQFFTFSPQEFITSGKNRQSIA